MSVQGNIAPGSGTRVSTATLVRRIVLLPNQTRSSRFSILGIGRVTVSILQTGGAPGATAELRLIVQGQNADVVDEVTVLALNTPFQLGGHIAGSEVEVRMQGAGATDVFVLIIQATGTS